MTSKSAIGLVSYAMAMFVAACSSSSHSVARAVTAPRTVNPPSSTHPDIAPYLPRFISAVEALGFRVARTDDPSALQLRVDFNPSVMNMRVSAALWQNGVPIVTADAANSGWGTALARGTAVQNLVESAAKAFQVELRKMSSSLHIEEDKSPDVTTPVSTGEVTIDASIANADVLIDGKFVGNTPMNLYKLAAGEHAIEVRAAGYASWTRTLTVVGGTISRVAATLEPAPRLP